jgi:hypothetical protein
MKNESPSSRTAACFASGYSPANRDMVPKIAPARSVYFDTYCGTS